MVWRKVLHQHEGHVRIGICRQAREEGLEGRQSTCRGTYADDGERYRFLGLAR